jgi:hypothetical protein
MKWRFVDALIAVTLGLVLAAATWKLHAAESFRAPDQYGRPMALKLLDDPCPTSVVKWLPMRVKEEFHAGMRKAVLHWGGADWDACWIEVDGNVYSIDSEGVMLNGGRGLPRRLFRDDSI